MNESFKHISIFVIFLCSALYLNKLRKLADRYFEFDFGDTALLFCYSTLTVIVFHLLYHYFGRWPEKVAYILSSLIVILTVILAHNKML